MPKGDPSVVLSPVTYEKWVKEDPKPVDEGPIKLESLLYFDDPNAVKFEARHVESKMLPRYYSDKTMIFSEYDEFNGFKIYVTPIGYDYLLRADQKHPQGRFKATNGKTYFDHPHFHELDFSVSMRGLGPSELHVVEPMLHNGMDSADFLEAFLFNYYFDDGREGPIQPPKKAIKQKGLDEFY